MISIFIWIGFVLILCFSFVVLFGAPFLPTLKQQQIEALSLLNLKPGETLLELGCGDGRVLISAAKKGIKGIGYELNPVLYLMALINTRRYRKFISIKLGNFWLVDWPYANGIYVFLLQRYMEKLDKKIIQSYDSKVKLVSYAFKIPGKKPLTTEKGLYLYEYKAGAD